MRRSDTYCSSTRLSVPASSSVNVSCRIDGLTPLSLVLQRPRLRDHLPLRSHLRVALARPPLPDLLGARLRMPPPGVDVHHRERSIPLARHHDLLDLPPVVHQGVRVEQLLPAPLPALRVEAAEHHHPRHRIVRLRRRRPRPDHGGMKAGDEQLDILRVPRPGLAIDDVADLLLDGVHRRTTSRRARPSGRELRGRAPWLARARRLTDSRRAPPRTPAPPSFARTRPAVSPASPTGSGSGGRSCCGTRPP